MLAMRSTARRALACERAEEPLSSLQRCAFRRTRPDAEALPSSLRPGGCPHTDAYPDLQAMRDGTAARLDVHRANRNESQPTRT
jgi:hypothetical protein